MKYKLDPEHVRNRAYFLSLENRKYTDLVQTLAYLDFKFSEFPPLDFTSGIIDVPSSLREYIPSYEHGRWVMLSYHSYMHRALPLQVLHWLIAERELLIESIERGEVA